MASQINFFMIAKQIKKKDEDFGELLKKGAVKSNNFSENYIDIWSCWHNAVKMSLLQD